ncbi:MAG: sugar phosphate isomerase/epimerase [Clostridia bacterium]|nr:sugar phosphate isomerase/epimerase [Clostridia bacterium]
MKLGAQFYSIRDRSATPEDLRLSFERMHEIGYEVAQMSGICQIEPERLKSFSEEFSLPIVCTHSPFDRIVNDTDKLISEHIIYGCPVIGIGAMPQQYQGSAEGVRAFLDVVKEPMKRIKDAGLNFAYHNHAFEFVLDGDRPLFDIMIEDAPDLNFILDTYWVKYGGYDALDYIKRIGAARMTNVHLKDMKTEPKGEICPCGVGIIDFKPIITLCDSLGIPNALVEQDNAPDSGDSHGQMAISFSNVKPLM